MPNYYTTKELSVISKRNLFIVNTPLQLTTAYVIAHSYFIHDDNVLVIAQPKQYQRWHKEPLIKCLLSQNKVWSNIYSMTGQDIRKKTILDFKKYIDELKINIQANGHVFLGNDKQIVNQILVELSGNKTYNRFDEGLGSYTPGTVKRKLRSKVGEYLIIKAMQLIFRCNQGLQYNFNGMGCGQSAIKDYLYNPKLLTRYSPQVIEITRDQIRDALLSATDLISPNDQLQENQYLVYLGSSYSILKSDLGAIIENELIILQQISQWAQSTGRKVLYKPHPGEPPEKLALYKKNISNIVFYDSIEPIELICNKNNKISYMISLFSSGMLHLDKFTTSQIKTITIANLLENKIGKTLVTDRQKDIMNICNIVFPNNIEELKQLISE